MTERTVTAEEMESFLSEMWDSYPEYKGGEELYQAVVATIKEHTAQGRELLVLRTEHELLVASEKENAELRAKLAGVVERARGIGLDIRRNYRDELVLFQDEDDEARGAILIRDLAAEGEKK